MTTQPNSVDAIYIDGSHEGQDVMANAVMSWRLLKVGGVLLFDDYEWPGEGRRRVLPKVAIDAFCTLVEPWGEVVMKNYQLAIRKDAT